MGLFLLLLLAPAWAREGVFLAAGVGHLEGLSLLLRGAALEVGVAFPPPALGLGLLVPFSASELGETYWGGGATLRPGEGFLASAYLGFRWGREVGQDLFWQLGRALLGREVFLPLRGFVETGAGAGLRGGRPAVAWHLRVGFALLEGPLPVPAEGALPPPSRSGPPPGPGGGPPGPPGAGL
ncbi:hypothetical protein [Thermus sp.]|uniref:hypothetical protein n=1 Tax=Thermus sp. TaxID=275 RepID=UPI00298F2F34|nr:hypothetical protein [Thermus sp.]MDW8358825.1 hypothetical protein [Thermus sp.]